MPGTVSWQLSSLPSRSLAARSCRTRTAEMQHQVPAFARPVCTGPGHILPPEHNNPEGLTITELEFSEVKGNLMRVNSLRFYSRFAPGFGPDYRYNSISVHISLGG